ncbi:hypothetical protein L1278_000096 [Pontibacter sp. HSC-36F09]|nr:hypothetical protein [Pontibacter sp. HSC-36F09]
MVNYIDGILLEDTSAFLAWDVDVQKQTVASLNSRFMSHQKTDYIQRLRHLTLFYGLMQV